MKLHILYKTTCLVNGRVHIGIYRTDDIFWGTPHFTDEHIGLAKEMVADLKKYGRNAFIVEAIRAFPTEEEAVKVYQNFKHLDTYRPAPYVRTEELRQHYSKIFSNGGSPRIGKKHDESAKKAIAEARRRIRWVHKGNEERTIDRNDPLPEGWTYGRSKALREKVSQGMMKTNIKSTANITTTQS